MKKRLIHLSVLASILAQPVFAGDWPQWRGPKRDAISTESGWSVAWPKEGLKQVWKAEVGAGYGTVSVSKGRLYVMGNTADKDTVYCLDASTGKEVWKHEYPEPLAPKYYSGGSSGTPTVHEGKVYFASKQGKVFCLDEDGVTFVLRAGDKFELLHTNKLADDDMCMATPAIAGDRLLIRTSQRVYCVRQQQ